MATWALGQTEMKSQTPPWALPVQGGTQEATGTISDVWAAPRSPAVSGAGRSREERGGQGSGLQEA